MMKKKIQKRPLCWADLEAWRLRHGLSTTAAYASLGLYKERWIALQKNPTAPIQDATIGILLALYESHPEVIPFRFSVDFVQYMSDLGYEKTKVSDKKRCAVAIGRNPAAVDRWLNGTPLSRPVECLIEGIQRLPVSGEEKRELLESLARQVGESRGIPDLFEQASWRSNELEEETQ